MATKKINPKAMTRRRKAVKKEKGAPAINAGAKTKIKAPQFTVSDQVRCAAGALVVRGTVREASGKPAKNARVRTYGQDLRKKQLLGKAVTDAEGRYKISYTFRKFLSAEKGRADLLVVVVDAKGKELVSSEVLFNVPSEASIDLTLPPNGKTLSEFELLLKAILPLIAGQGKGGADLNITELEEKDIDFLSQESGQPQEHIGSLLAAIRAAEAVSRSQRLAIGTNAVGSRGSTIPVGAFYGWFRQGLPTDLDELFDQGVDMLRRTLDASLRANIIPAALGDALDSITAKTRKRSVTCTSCE